MYQEILTYPVSMSKDPVTVEIGNSFVAVMKRIHLENLPIENLRGGEGPRDDILTDLGISYGVFQSDVRVSRQWKDAAVRYIDTAPSLSSDKNTLRKRFFVKGAVISEDDIVKPGSSTALALRWERIFDPTSLTNIVELETRVNELKDDKSLSSREKIKELRHYVRRFGNGFQSYNDDVRYEFQKEGTLGNPDNTFDALNKWYDVLELHRKLLSKIKSDLSGEDELDIDFDDEFEEIDYAIREHRELVCKLVIFVNDH